MKLISSSISLIIYISLSLALISFVAINIREVVERSRISNVFFLFFEQLKLLDKNILQVNSLDVGSRIIFRIQIPEGRLVLKNGKIKYELETISTFNFLKDIIKSFDNLIANFRNISLKCTIRENSCLEDESCMFSMYKLINSHIGDCSVYNYKVCCKGLELRKSEVCYESEAEIVRMLKEENSHAGFEKYSLRICSYPIVRCSLKNKCSNSEVCFVSFYKDFNSHAAECNYYSNNLCCYTSFSEIGELILSYLNIEIIGEFVLYRGEYSLVIEKIGENKIRIYIL